MFRIDAIGNNKDITVTATCTRKRNSLKVTLFHIATLHVRKLSYSYSYKLGCMGIILKMHGWDLIITFRPPCIILKYVYPSEVTLSQFAVSLTAGEEDCPPGLTISSSR